MPLTPAQSLSHYRLIEPIGEGGMGVVWRATDSALGRDVAIKVLPDEFAADPERLARFEREARLLAALNHPNVASIYGLHSADGVRFLAMELVEGEDLAQRLKRGAVPVAEALPLALQIAQALEHAHEKGVIHRDLKPSNIKLTSGGQAKVLDFGLAKALEGEVARPVSSSMISQSPTITGHMTGMNVLLGTAAYMAPEQARGQVADKRADIWAFGVVLWEMIAGRQLFEGETISDTLASVLKTDPDWSALPRETPPRIRTLVRRCLERDPKRRLRDIGEARILLEEVIAGRGDETPAAAAPAPVASARVPIAAIAIAGILAGAIAMFGLSRMLERPAHDTPLRKFRLAVPSSEGATPSLPAISPDGRAVAYLFHDQLWVQSLRDLEPKQLTVEPGASRIAWSPDGKAIAYIAGTRIMRVALAGAENQAVCDTRGQMTGGQGLSWKEDGKIVFSRGDSAGLLEVPVLGGDPHTILAPDTSETDFHEPSVLPGDRGILFCGHRRRGGINNICVWSGGKRRLLLELAGQKFASPIYSSSGYIHFQRGPTTPGIWAVPFSLDRLQITGDPFLVVPGGSNPSVSAEGTLAFVSSGAAAATEMVWVDRDGKEQGVIGQPEAEAAMFPALSPDGKRVARAITANDNRDIWIYDTARGTRTRLTFESSTDDVPAWSPSGDRIAYHSQPKGLGGAEGIESFMRAADGTGGIDTLALGAAPTVAADGRHVFYLQLLQNGAIWNLMEIPLERPRTPRMLMRGNPWVMGARVSPQGSLMAYMSFESGQWEVFLMRYPSGEGKWQVSAAGGQWPKWSAKGDRLYFCQAEDVMEVDIGGAATPTLGAPRRLFTRASLGTGNFGWYPAFDVTGDGKRFIVIRSAGQRGLVPGIAVAQNWAAEFEKDSKRN
jgi:serine/threonine-protein kinase